MKLTERQQEMLGYIRDYIKQHGIAPNTTEAAIHFDKSRQTCSDMMKKLHAIGAIEFNATGVRSLRIVGDDMQPVKVNLVSPVIEINRGHKSGPKVMRLSETETPEVAFKTSWLIKKWVAA